MRKIKREEENGIKILARHGIKAHTFDQLLKKFAKNKEFRKGYAEEMARLKLAGQIRAIRTSKKMTQKAVALKSGMPQSVIARIESGEHSVSVDTLSKVAHAFGKEVELV
jgi:DNA-binding XRE family transcriptional regulator